MTGMLSCEDCRAYEKTFTAIKDTEGESQLYKDLSRTFRAHIANKHDAFDMLMRSDAGGGKRA